MVCSFHVQLWLSVDNMAFQQPMKSMSGYHSNNWTLQHANYTNTIHQGERTSAQELENIKKKGSLRYTAYNTSPGGMYKLPIGVMRVE